VQMEYWFKKNQIHISFLKIFNCNHDIKFLKTLNKTTDRFLFIDV
jgi:hypothetical protein